LFLCPEGAAGFQPGFNPGNRPINGSALKGRKLTWINPTRIAPQNEFRGPDNKGTGQIREKVKGDENEIGIAGGRSLSLKAREGAGVANK